MTHQFIETLTGFRIPAQGKTLGIGQPIISRSEGTPHHVASARKRLYPVPSERIVDTKPRSQGVALGWDAMPLQGMSTLACFA